MHIAKGNLKSYYKEQKSMVYGTNAHAIQGCLVVPIVIRKARWMT